MLLARRARARRRRAARLPFDGRRSSTGSRSPSARSSSSTALLPQSWLGGGATHKGVLYAARHDLLPVGAYFLGRGLDLTGARARARSAAPCSRRRRSSPLFGLVDVYAVPLSWWRHSARGWFQRPARPRLPGLSDLPENFVYNAGNGVVFRRLTSTFLSPLATALPARRRAASSCRCAGAGDRRSRVLLFAALLWTHTRAALLALVVGAARARRRAARVRGRSLVARRGRGRRARVREGLRPLRAAHALHARASCTYQEQHAATQPAGVARPDERGRVVDERAPRRACATGTRTVVHHPWGFGLGNAGVTAARTHVAIEGRRVDLHRARRRDRARSARSSSSRGRSCCSARSLRAAPWLGAAFAAVLVLGLQTDVIGVPWIAVAVWALAGDSA